MLRSSDYPVGPAYGGTTMHGNQEHSSFAALKSQDLAKRGRQPTLKEIGCIYSDLYWRQGLFMTITPRNLNESGPYSTCLLI